MNEQKSTKFVKLTLVSILSVLFLSVNLYSSEKDTTLISEHLKPLLPFVGKTWKGEFTNSTPDKPMVDIQKWELILNGQVIRIMHSLNDGMYGGETIVLWDKEKEKLAYFYFTTQGFYTQGTFEFDGEKYIGREKVTGNEGGITEVKSEGKILDDGRLHSKSYYLKNGEWIEGHEIYYHEDPDAVLKFKQ